MSVLTALMCGVASPGWVVSGDAVTPAAQAASSQPFRATPAPPMSGTMASSMKPAEYIPGDEAAFPRIRYGDDLISVNDRCPVRHAKLNLRMEPIYVNGLPVGFC